MNKKEYTIIADVFANHRKRYGNRTDSVALELINDMTDELAQEYTNFDRDKFLTACGVTETDKTQ